MEALGADGREPLQCLSLNLWLETTVLPTPLGRPTLDCLRLKSLCIEDLPLLSLNAGQSWSETVIGLLRGSPHLEYLKLSAAIGGYYNNEIRSVFRNLCIGYKQEGGQPLQLKMLNLGEGMLLVPNTWAAVTQVPAYLYLLTKPEFLEELHLFNVQHAQNWLVPLAYGLISPRATPRLRHVYIDYMDCVAYHYLTVAFNTPHMTQYIRQLEVHVESTGFFGQYRHPPRPAGKPAALGLDPADMFSSRARPLEVAGLGLGHMEVGGGWAPVLDRPWARLRSLTVALWDRQVAGFGLMCARHTGSLERLLVRVVSGAPGANEAGVRARVEDCALVVARRNLGLGYVRFECSSVFWARDLVLSWKNRDGGFLYWNMEAARIYSWCVDTVEEPEAFWTEARKVLYLADGDLF